jgi:hypothetical protein
MRVKKRLSVCFVVNKKFHHHHDGPTTVEPVFSLVVLFSLFYDKKVRLSPAHTKTPKNRANQCGHTKVGNSEFYLVK